MIANTGTLCAEFAGVAAGMELLGGISRYLSVPLAASAVSALVLRGELPPRRARPARAQLGLRRLRHRRRARPPRLGRGRAGPRRAEHAAHPRRVLVAVATVGTTLAPWGLAFIQSYAVDKRLTRRGPALRAHRRRRGRRADRRHRRSSSSSPAPRPCTRPGRIDRRPRRRRGRSSRWPAASPPPSSAPASSAPPSWPRRSCRSPPRTRLRGVRPPRRPRRPFRRGAALLRQLTALSSSSPRRSC